MNKSIFRKMFAKYLLPSMAVCMMLGVQSCLDEYAPGQYYTFTGSTVADFLKNDEQGRFTNFIYALDQAGMLGELDTYGNYTCFAPVNAGFDELFKSKGVTSIDQLSRAQCETIAWTHVIGSLFYCKDLSAGAPLAYPNMLGRYMMYEAGEDIDPETQIHIPRYYLNGAEIIHRDDSVANGVVHIMNKALNPSSNTLDRVMAMDTTISWFCEALEATGMGDSLATYKDESYTINDIDSCDYQSNNYYKVSQETDYWQFPRERLFKYTAFVEQNSVLKEKSGGVIHDFKSLVEYAQSVYDPGGSFYKEGKLSAQDIKDGYYNSEDESYERIVIDKDGKEVIQVMGGYTNRNHPINKFVSYHLLPEELFYTTFNMVGRGKGYESYESGFLYRDELDVEDFYSPMLKYSVMRISSPQGGGKYINRRGAKGDPDGIIREGIEIRNMANETYWQNGEYLTMNGTYHYINDILVYDNDTRTVALNCRMRFMASTLSPDYINSGARGRLLTQIPNSQREVYGFKRGYCKNVERTEQTESWLRYICADFDCTRGDELNFRGPFDISHRLPPVPTDGMYEIRLHTNTLETNATQGLIAASDRAIIQAYLGKENKETGKVEYVACGLPLDMSITASDPRLGNITDADLREEAGDDEELAAELINALDKALHNRGYMKGIDSYKPRSTSGGKPLRDVLGCIRLILTTTDMSANDYYWLRIRVADPSAGTDLTCAFGCLEIVPKSVYANPDKSEDRH